MGAYPEIPVTREEDAAWKEKSKENHRKYLAYIKTCRCCICMENNKGVDPHHVISRGAGGSDYCAIPLCRQHHTEIHQIGKVRFADKYKIDLWQTIARAVINYLERI